MTPTTNVIVQLEEATATPSRARPCLLWRVPKQGCVLPNTQYPTRYRTCICRVFVSATGARHGGAIVMVCRSFIGGE